MFPLEPPTAPMSELAHEAAGPVSFIPDTPVIEDVVEPMVAEEPGAANLLEQELYGVGQAVEATPEEYMPVTPEEAETLSAPADTSTVVFRAGDSPWGQPSPAEPFATPSPAAIETSAPAFEEVFEEEIPPAVAPAPAFEPVVLPPLMVPEPASVLAVAPGPVASAPEEAPELHPDGAEPVLPPEVSFADVAPAPPEAPAPAPPSGAANVAVPVEMVAQISERVVREVAWEVIPDLAEALIKKEIERLKAELQNT